MKRGDCIIFIIIEIDQSGKIENTSKDTVIAFSNNEFSGILIKAKDKREIQKIFRKIGKPRIFIYRLFAILIFLLIKNHLKKIDRIIIDEEYPGQSNLIKSFFMQEARKLQPKFSASDITFKRIGKKSRAHYLAYGITIGKKLPDKTVNAKEVLKLMMK